MCTNLLIEVMNNNQKKAKQNQPTITNKKLDEQDSLKNGFHSTTTLISLNKKRKIGNNGAFLAKYK